MELNEHSVYLCSQNGNKNMNANRRAIVCHKARVQSRYLLYSTFWNGNTDKGDKTKHFIWVKKEKRIRNPLAIVYQLSEIEVRYTRKHFNLLLQRTTQLIETTKCRPISSFRKYTVDRNIRDVIGNCQKLIYDVQLEGNWLVLYTGGKRTNFPMTLKVDSYAKSVSHR